MERFVYPSYSIYQSYGNAFSHSHNVAPRPPSKQKQPGWKQSKSSRSSIPSPYRGPLSAPSSAPLPPPPSSPDYLDSYKRAQLKALLSQVSPGLAPRLRKASTKEVGTQVNPRVDAAVQCSLGSRQPEPPRAGPCPEEEAAAEEKKPPTGREGGQQAEEPDGKKPLEPEKGAQEPAEAKLPGSGEGEEPAQQLRDGEGDVAQKDAAAAAAPATEGKRAAFQFLEQKYGYFHCNDCKTRWESAYVWCISGTNKVYFKQLCRKCQKSFNPYKVEAIQCRICAKTRCSCPQKKRHIDLKRPHRQELCGRCKGKRLSCDNTYSFKYII
nr:LOW QUALITY PROTEIN: ZAR1-like protein [Zootoca vivipara]